MTTRQIQSTQLQLQQRRQEIEFLSSQLQNVSKINDIQSYQLSELSSEKRELHRRMELQKQRFDVDIQQTRKQTINLKTRIKQLLQRNKEWASYHQFCVNLFILFVFVCIIILCTAITENDSIGLQSADKNTFITTTLSECDISLHDEFIERDHYDHLLQQNENLSLRVQELSQGVCGTHQLHLQIVSLQQQLEFLRERTRILDSMHFGSGQCLFALEALNDKLTEQIKQTERCEAQHVHISANAHRQCDQTQELEISDCTHRYHGLQLTASVLFCVVICAAAVYKWSFSWIRRQEAIMWPYASEQKKWYRDKQGRLSSFFIIPQSD